jgi:N-acetylmuramic acid 6-phosphate (MurNAc-6-P) etherase
VTGLDETEAAARLQAAGGEVKTAIVSSLAQVPPPQARRRLQSVDGSVRRAVEIEGGDDAAGA